MHRKSTGRHQTAAIIGLAFALGLNPTVGQAMDSSDDEPAEATSGEMDDHAATSKDPDELTAKSHDPNEMTVGSETMEGRMAESENPATMGTSAGQLSEHESSSTDLTNLNQARPDEGYENIESPGQPEWESTTDPGVLVARKHLVRAQQRARYARTAYGDMMERNYPRGAARIQIVNERDASMKALEEAKSALTAAEH